MVLSEMEIKKVKDVLYHYYKTDDYFPRSCGAVSMALAYLFELSELSNRYNITYQRGHYRNTNEEDYCHELEYGFKRGDDLENFPCFNCSCDYMVGHSWIELEHKETKETIILDFTSIQFREDFRELLEDDFDKDGLCKCLSFRSPFVVEEDDYRFNNYINSERVYTGRYIVQEVEDTINSDSFSELTIALESMGYLK